MEAADAGCFLLLLIVCTRVGQVAKYSSKGINIYGRNTPEASYGRLEDMAGADSIPMMLARASLGACASAIYLFYCIHSRREYVCPTLSFAARVIASKTPGG